MDGQNTKIKTIIVVLLAYRYSVTPPPHLVVNEVNKHSPERSQVYTGCAKDSNLLHVSKDHSADIFTVQLCKAYTKKRFSHCHIVREESSAVKALYDIPHKT